MKKIRLASLAIATATSAAALLFNLAFVTSVRANEPNCTQQLVDGTIPPPTTYFIYPRQTVTPFYQWENNDGYCGEVSMMEAGLNNGQWMSQFNARLVCGTGLSQSGPDGACRAHHGNVDYNAQLLIEDPGTGASGPNVYADAAQCLSNSRLQGSTFDYTAQTPGMTGYEQYMTWVKKEIIRGHQVTVGVLINGYRDPQYDHEVTVIKIGTNHSPSDATYYVDDVLYIEDHGAYTMSGDKFTSNPAIPPGAGADDVGCTPYVFGYTFGSLAQTREGANRKHAHGYSIVIPGDVTIHTGAGGTGYDTVAISGPHNYGFSVAGPVDRDSETLPVAITIAGPTYTDGVPNPLDPLAEYDYENGMIGSSSWGRSCTNRPPAAWMTNVQLDVNVSGLTAGVAYNLYEYDFSSVAGVGLAAALAVPVAEFNANANLATKVTTFTATSATYATSVTTTSDKVVVFRCVAVGAP